MLAVVTMPRSAAKRSAIDLEGVGSGPVDCHFPFPSLSVRYMCSSPTGGNNIVSRMYTVTFGPHNLIAALSIGTHCERNEEGPEFFQVIILSTNSGNVVVGAAGTANVAITNTTDAT